MSGPFQDCDFFESLTAISQSPSVKMRAGFQNNSVPRKPDAITPSKLMPPAFPHHPNRKKLLHKLRASVSEYCSGMTVFGERSREVLARDSGYCSWKLGKFWQGIADIVPGYLIR
jgi:hypothetical protein